MLVGRQRNFGGFGNVANIDCRYTDGPKRIGVHGHLGEHVSEGRIVLEKVVWTNDGKRHVKTSDCALDSELRGEVRNILEMLDAKHRVVDDVRKLALFGEIVGDQPLGQLIWGDSVEKIYFV